MNDSEIGIAKTCSDALKKEHRTTRMHYFTDLKEAVMDQTSKTETPQPPLAVNYLIQADNSVQNLRQPKIPF